MNSSLSIIQSSSYHRIQKEDRKQKENAEKCCNHFLMKFVARTWAVGIVNYLFFIFSYKQFI